MFLGDFRIRGAVLGLAALVCVGVVVTAGRWVAGGLAPPPIELAASLGATAGDGAGPGDGVGRGGAAGQVAVAGAEGAAKAQSVDPEPLVAVHVCGRVKQPGVYRFPAGARPRVVDAVEAAGGFSSGADREAVNLARPIVDGEQVYVPEAVAAGGAPAGVGPRPRVGSGGAGERGVGPAQVTAARAQGFAGTGPSPAGAGGAGVADGVTAGGRVNVNAASAAELEALPGVGPVLAARIIERRRGVGPFTGLADLMEVQGIGPGLSSRLERLIVFGPAL